MILGITACASCEKGESVDGVVRVRLAEVNEHPGIALCMFGDTTRDLQGINMDAQESISDRSPSPPTFPAADEWCVDSLGGGLPRFHVLFEGVPRRYGDLGRQTGRLLTIREGFCEGRHGLDGVGRRAQTGATKTGRSPLEPAPAPRPKCSIAA